MVSQTEGGQRRAPAGVLDAVGRTGLIPAAVRAAENLRNDRLFADRYAAHFTGSDGMVLLSELDELYRAVDIGWITDYFAVRIRYYDDLLERAVRSGIRQIVLPAVSMDCRAFRLDWPRDVRVFEIDRAPVLAAKQAILDSVGARPTAERIQVVADLTGRWEPSLLAAGYSPREPSAWVFEGLLCYLPGERVHDLLSRIRNLCAAGSLLGADVHNEADLNSGFPAVLDWFSRLGAPFRSAYAHPGRLWAEHGFTATIAIPGLDGAGYGRVPRLASGQVLSYFVSGERKTG